MRRHQALVASVACIIALAIPMNAVAATLGTPLIPNTNTIDVKKANPDGSIPKKWDLPKPKKVPHPDVAPETAGGRAGDGSNDMSFGGYGDGDMIVVLGTATGHAGEWDDPKYFGSRYSKCIWSANTAPVNGVQLEQPIKYNAYDAAYGLWVPSLNHKSHVAARDYCRRQNGEPYVISSSKSNEAAWYCSKLLWSSYSKTAGVNLDADGGYWVWPIDILNDSQAKVFASAS